MEEDRRRLPAQKSVLDLNKYNCTVTGRDSRFCTSRDGQEYYVRDVFPPIQELEPGMMVVIAIYFLCFIVGICGNASILTMIRGILYERKNPRLFAFRRTDNAILYIAALCMVDLLMSLSLPPTVMDSIIGFWMFGTEICKLHHICGSVGRILSTFLITAMSFDRFVAVCHPYKKKFRTRKFAIYTIVALWTLALLLLLPMLTYASADEILIHQMRQRDPNNPRLENITNVRIYKCRDMMPQLVFYWFTMTTFILGYLVPLVLIIYFNSQLIGKLYRHTKQLRTTIPLRRISIYTILIAVCYFFCWTPYWCSVLYATYMSLFSDERKTSELLLFIIYCVHLLPYIGSASNWVLYGLLNTQLQVRDPTTMGGTGAQDECCTLNTLISPFQQFNDTTTLVNSSRNGGLRLGSIPTTGGGVMQRDRLLTTTTNKNMAFLCNGADRANNHNIVATTNCCNHFKQSHQNGGPETQRRISMLISGYIDNNDDNREEEEKYGEEEEEEEDRESDEHL